jgi:hypothetical protein
MRRGQTARGWSGRSHPFLTPVFELLVVGIPSLGREPTGPPHTELALVVSSANEIGALTGRLPFVAAVYRKSAT